MIKEINKAKIILKIIIHKEMVDIITTLLKILMISLEILVDLIGNSFVKSIVKKKIAFLGYFFDINIKL